MPQWGRCVMIAIWFRPQARRACTLVASERFEFREAEHRVGTFGVNEHGVIFVQVRASRQIVVLIALVGLQRPQIQVVESTFRLCVVVHKRDVDIRAARRREIAQLQILPARLLVDGGASVRMPRIPFKSTRKDWLRVSARIKGRGLGHFLIDLQFFGPEGPPQCNEDR